MIEVKFNFTNASEAAAFLVSVQNIGVRAGAPGLALESGEFVPAKELNEGNAAARSAAGQGTAKADAAQSKTAKNKDIAAASAGTEPQGSTAVTTDQATAAFEGNGAAGSTEQGASAASTASSTAPVEYPVLQKAVFALATKSRDAAAGVAASFGVKTFKDLPQDKWGDALAAVNAKIVELG